MKIYLLLIILSFRSISHAKLFKAKDTCNRTSINKIISALSVKKVSNKNTIVKAVIKNGKSFDIDCRLLVTILKVESDFNRYAINPFTGEIGISQINHKLWKNELAIVKKYFLNLSKIKPRSSYYKIYKQIPKIKISNLKNINHSIQIMSSILYYYRHKFHKKDPIWFARYNSGLYVHKLEYLHLLEYQFKKIKIADYFINYTEKTRLVTHVVKKHGFKRVLEIYTRLSSKKIRNEKYKNRFKKKS